MAKKTIDKKCVKTACEEQKNQVTKQQIVMLCKELSALYDQIKDDLLLDSNKKYNYAAAQRVRVKSFELSLKLKEYRKMTITFANYRPVSTTLNTNSTAVPKNARSKKI